MDFFLIVQDNRVLNLPKLAGISRTQTKKATPNELESELFLIKEQEDPVDVDFIEHPVPLVSDRLKQLLKSFDQRCVFTPAVLGDIKRGAQYLYWRLIPPAFYCRATDLEFTEDRTLRQVTLPVSLPAHLRVFKVERVAEEMIFINLIVLESMLRRGFTGFKFTRIELKLKS
jgi:hypothetical protein